LSQKFFNMLATGRFAPHQIETQLVEGSLKRSKASEAFIERVWQQHVKELEEKGKSPWANDLKPSRFRLARIRVNGDRLAIDLDPCVTYRDHIGTQNHPEFEAMFGRDYVPDGLAVSNLMITADEYTILTHRNQSTDYKPGGWHASFGGFLDIKKDKNPVMGTRRESGEESGIPDEDIFEVICIGAAYNPWTLHTDILFSSRTTRKAVEVKACKGDNENRLLFIQTSAASYEYWMLQAAHASVVIPLASMLIVGSTYWGQRWADLTLARLAEQSQGYDDPEIRAKLERQDLGRFDEMVKLARKTGQAI
jgi:hypothetical protein